MVQFAARAGHAVRWRKVCAIGLTSSVLFATSSLRADADTMTVCGSGCDYSSIAAALSAAIAGDTIEVAAGTYSGGIVIDKELTLRGAGAESTAIQGGETVIHVRYATSVVIEGFTITGGSYTNNNTSERIHPFNSGGGGLYLREAEVDLVDCVITGNQANGSSVNGANHTSNNARGGGIFTHCSVLTLTRSSVTNNTAEGIDVSKDGIEGTAWGGTAYGGGIYTFDSRVSVVDSTVSGNEAIAGNGIGGARGNGYGGDAAGGGVYISASLNPACSLYLSEGLVSFDRSTVSRNKAIGGLGIGGSDVDDFGGVGWGGDAFGGGVATLSIEGFPGFENSTVSGNVATAGNGCAGTGEDAGSSGGWAYGGAVRSGSVTFDRTTVAFNRAIGGRGLEYMCNAPLEPSPDRAFGGAFNYYLTTYNPYPIRAVYDSIVVANEPDDCAQDTINSGGYNIESGTSCGFDDVNDIQNAGDYVGLMPLGDYGGPTQTHLLYDRSMAVDAANPVGCWGTDQRGVVRPQDATPGGGEARCDIGAVEYDPGGTVDTSAIFGDGLEYGNSEAWSETYPNPEAAL